MLTSCRFAVVVLNHSSCVANNCEYSEEVASDGTAAAAARLAGDCSKKDVSASCLGEDTCGCPPTMEAGSAVIRDMASGSRTEGSGESTTLDTANDAPGGAAEVLPREEGEGARAGDAIAGLPPLPPY